MSHAADSPPNAVPAPRRIRFRWVAMSLVGVVLVGIAIFFLSLPDVSGLRRQNPIRTSLMEARLAAARAAGHRLRIHQHWVPFNRIPERLRQAVRISEDASFYQHEGVDYHELKESIKRDWQEKRLARGASTITQQLAKNLYLSTEKSFLRKIREVFIAWSLEKHLSKQRIFELYLNVIEFGPGIFGVDAAARTYFNKPVEALNLTEIIRLVAVIPRPLKTSPLSNSGWVRWRGRWILGLMRRYGYISEDEYQAAIPEFRK